MQLFKGSSNRAAVKSVWTVLFKNCESLGIRKLFGVITKDKVQAFFLQITHKQANGTELAEVVF